MTSLSYRTTILLGCLLVMSLAAFITVGATMIDRPNILPISQDEVSAYTQSVQDRLTQTVNDLAAIPTHERSFNNTIKQWNRHSSDLLAALSTLDFVGRSDLPGDEQAVKSLQTLVMQLFQVQVQDPTLRTCLLDSARNLLTNSDQSNPYENHHVESLLQDGERIIHALTPEELATLDHLRALNAGRPKEPFLTLRGLAAPKTNEQSDKTAVSILTLNTCFTPGQMGYLYGGVKPWKERLEPLTKKIRSTDADVVCLQEVYAEDASEALYEALKQDYAFFYGAIGPRPFGYSPDRLGQPSGLFVASKYAIDHPRFTLYDATLHPMNFGFFDFIIKDDNAPLAHIYTTHMQPLHMEGAPEVRGQQVQQFVHRMKEDAALDPHLPHFLCGDLNIAWGSGEPGEAILRKHFVDAYNHNRTTVDPSDASWTEYFTKIFFEKYEIPMEIKDESGILDYALLLKASKGHQIQTTLIQTSDRNAPETLISDHHGLLTIITSNP